MRGPKWLLAVLVSAIHVVAFSQVPDEQKGNETTCGDSGSVSLSAAQLKNRLAHFVPISPPSMREKFKVTGVLKLRVGIGSKGTVTVSVS